MKDPEITEEMRKAGAEIASDLLVAYATHQLDRSNGKDWQEFEAKYTGKNLDLIRQYVNSQIESVTAIYIAMHRASTRKIKDAGAEKLASTESDKLLDETLLSPPPCSARRNTLTLRAVDGAPNQQRGLYRKVSVGRIGSDAEIVWEYRTPDGWMQAPSEKEAMVLCLHNISVSIPGGEPGYAPGDCSALVKECEGVVKYLREIGEQCRDQSEFPSGDYADAVADSLENVLKQNTEVRHGAKDADLT